MLGLSSVPFVYQFLYSIILFLPDNIIISSTIITITIVTHSIDNSIFADTRQFFVSSRPGGELVDLHVRIAYDAFLPVKTSRFIFNELVSIESYNAHAELLTVNQIAVLLYL